LRLGKVAGLVFHKVLETRFKNMLTSASRNVTPSKCCKILR